MEKPLVVEKFNFVEFDSNCVTFDVNCPHCQKSFKYRISNDRNELYKVDFGKLDSIISKLSGNEHIGFRITSLKTVNGNTFIKGTFEMAENDNRQYAIQCLNREVLKEGY